jgi:hypothetical protein
MNLAVKQLIFITYAIIFRWRRTAAISATPTISHPFFNSHRLWKGVASAEQQKATYHVKGLQVSQF